MELQAIQDRVENCCGSIRTVAWEVVCGEMGLKRREMYGSRFWKLWLREIGETRYWKSRCKLEEGIWATTDKDSNSSEKESRGQRSTWVHGRDIWPCWIEVLIEVGSCRVVWRWDCQRWTDVCFVTSGGKFHKICTNRFFSQRLHRRSLK